MSSNLPLDRNNLSPSAEHSSAVQILYDGENLACIQEIAFWQERYRTRSPLFPFKITFVDLSLGGVDLNGRGKILVLLPDGKVLREQFVFQYLAKHLGLGLLFQVARWPGLGNLFWGWYQTWVTKTLPYSGRWSWQFQGNLPRLPEESHLLESEPDDHSFDMSELEDLLSDPLPSPDTSTVERLTVESFSSLDSLEEAVLDAEILEDIQGLEVNLQLEESLPDAAENIDLDLDLLDLELEDWGAHSTGVSEEGLDPPNLPDKPSVALDDLDLSKFSDLDSLLLEAPLPEEPRTSAAEEPFDENADLSLSWHSMNTLIESSGEAGNLGMPLGGFMEQFSALLPRRLDQTMKVPVRQLDSLSNLIAEMVVSRNCMESEYERVRQFLNNLLYQMQLLSDVGQRFQDLYERSLLENALMTSRQSFSHPNWYLHPQRTEKEFDALEMDHFSEFHLLSQEMIELIVRARESASDIDYVINEPLDYIARHFRQVTTQVQEGLNRARMVPFEQGTIRLPRAIREVASRSGKEAYLVVEGRDTLVDKVLLEQLYDPLTHLINNAVIHGIESPEERQKMGKDPCGKISIQAFYQGNQTIIVVKDDGAGIDAEKVRMKALKKGLINLMQAQTWKDIDILDFIFSPGLSTRDEVDTFAGRGVGLDVVKTKIENIRGKISVDSVQGKGTRFTIRLPLTLSIARALCCISNRARLAFPMDSVEDMLDLPEDQVKQDQEQRSYIQWRDQKIVLKSLTDLLKYNRSMGRSTVYAGGSGDDDMLSIVILRTTEDYLAFQVDRVEGEREIVIKQLERPIPKPPGIAGVTVLSDGQILPILDVLELAEIAQGRFRQPLDRLWKRSTPAVSEPQVQYQPVVLIVDDSITVRELLSMTFKKGNYRVEQARDGREAWEKLRSGLPCDLIFCDIEMPRMTGLELLEKLQRDPNLKKIPIAMLTSRGADRHRQLATQLGARAYFTKPYLEEVLLEAAQQMLEQDP
jgi:chemotaxis protein histidine kinase CheA/CheY-like chemotaxis protein